MRGFGVILSAMSALSLASCLDGVCNTAGGKSVNTYAFGGSWKKKTGYADGPRTETDLKKNYDVLIIEPGGVSGNKAKMCLVRVLDGVATGTLFQAQYTRDDKLKTVAIEYLESAKDYTTPGTAATFSFQGACNATGMTLGYTDAKATETYEIRSSTTVVGACSPAAAQ